MLKLASVEVHYQKVIYVIRGVSFEVPEGSIVLLLGGNGAGKTTTLKAISGLIRTEEGEITDGDIHFKNRRIDKLEAEEIAKMGIIQVEEGRRILRHLTVEENLLLGAYLHSDRARVKKNLEMVYDHYFARLAKLRGNVSGYLSGGEQQMLVIGRALMASPRCMLIDEPSLGLSPIVTTDIFEILAEIRREQGTSILLVEQNAELALQIGDYGYVMENGRVVLDGAVKELRENEDIKEFYLGLSAVGKKTYREVKHYRRRKRWLG